MAVPFGLELVLVLAALAVVVFVFFALPLVIRIHRGYRLKDFRKETRHV